MVISQGEVWWVDLPASETSGPAFDRPVVVVQATPFNSSRINTVLSVPLTTSMKHAEALGNLLLEPEATGLPRASVAVVCNLYPVDKRHFRERVGQVSPTALSRIISGLDLVLGR